MRSWPMEEPHRFTTAGGANVGSFLGLQVATLKMITFAIVGTLVAGGVTAGITVAVLAGDKDFFELISKLIIGYLFCCFVFQPSQHLPRVPTQHRSPAEFPQHSRLVHLPLSPAVNHLIFRLRSQVASHLLSRQHCRQALRRLSLPVVPLSIPAWYPAASPLDCHSARQAVFHRSSQLSAPAAPPLSRLARPASTQAPSHQWSPLSSLPLSRR